MIFIQSRGRRKSLDRFFSFSKPTMRGRVLIDDDDDSYESMVLPDGWEFYVRSRDSSSKILNRAFEQWHDEPFYAQIGDDYICKPEGWDKTLGKAAGSYHIAWGNDGRWGNRLCTSFFVGGDLVRKMGWFAHPELKHLYVDSVWWMIAKGAGLSRYCPEVRVEHLNVKDKTYQERRIKGDHEMFEKLRRESIGALTKLAAGFK